MRRDEGFTLIEVIVSMAILGISLVLIMQLFSAGLKSAKASCDYTIAIVHAKDKMEELSTTLDNDSGTFEDGFKWETEVQDYRQIEESEYKLQKLVVKIVWPEALKQQKSIEMVSLKMLTGEEKL
ncbi:MAG: type II secretion system protein [Nitrospiraceae bacterium]|nr:MAG: type II secretion system protein [Nitrospiraceae bacterium]